jgi:hypothetical protein
MSSHTITKSQAAQREPDRPGGELIKATTRNTSQDAPNNRASLTARPDNQADNEFRQPESKDQRP